MLKNSGTSSTGGADISATDIDEPDIQSVVTQIITAEAPDLLPYSALLNNVLLMSFEETDDSKEVRQSDLYVELARRATISLWAFITSACLCVRLASTKTTLA